MGRQTPEGMVTMAIRVVVGLGLAACVAVGAMAQSTGKPKVDGSAPVAALQQDLRLTLTAVDMQRQSGGAFEVSDRARALMADYAK
jgi:hypothetical protein